MNELNHFVGIENRNKKSNLEEVVETPSDNCVVVKCHVERDDGGCYANAAQVRRNLSPHSDSTFAKTLANS